MRRVRIGTMATAGLRRDAGNDTGARGGTDPATQRQGRRQMRPAAINVVARREAGARWSRRCRSTPST